MIGSNLSRRRFLKISGTGAVVVVVAGVGAYLALQPQPSPAPAATPRPSPAPAPAPAVPSPPPPAPAPAASPSPRPVTPAVTPSPTPTQTMIELAKKEGSVMAYGGWAGMVMKVLLGGFEAKYGIKTDYIEGYAPLVERTIAEARAGKYTMDVFFNSAPAALPLFEANLITEYTSKEDDVYPSEVKNPLGYSVSNHVVPIVIGYHADLKQENVPKSFNDLLNPKFKGRIGYYDPNFAPFLIVTVEKRIIGSDKFDAWLNAFKKQEPKVAPGPAPLLALITNREVDIGVFTYTSTMATEVAKGAPLKYVTAPGTVIGLPVGSFIHKNAPHPNAARLLKDYALSEEGTKLVADLGVYVSLRPGIPSRIAGIEAKDIILVPPMTFKDFEDARAKWNKVFVK